MTQLSDHYFGDLEAFDEAELNAEFFKRTFVVPSSLSMESLRNNRKFIIMGRKGAGKTTVQMHLSGEMSRKGYFVHHFRFFYDLRSDDYADIARTQSEVSYTSVSNQRSLFLHYDFRDVWERVIFQRIAQLITEEGHKNKFTDFVDPKGSLLGNIFEGITKGLHIKIQPQMGPIAAEMGFDFSKLNKADEISIKSYNKICRDLLKKSCNQFQLYFFIDELVFSRLDAKEDEITLRAAMVRDLVRTAWELNSYCAKNALEFHFICAMRPEVRNVINDLDSEAGKYLDGKDVELNWISGSATTRSLIYDVLVRKIEYSHHKKVIFNSFFAKTISFGDRTLDVEEFLRQNTWGRPRDVVRFLLAVQKKSPNSTSIEEPEIKAGLDEYSRMSFKELIDELGVTFGSELSSVIRQKVRKRFYQSEDELWDKMSLSKFGLDRVRFMTELFELGFYGGVKGKNFFWAHRGETYFKPDCQVMIHPGLWNELSIRGS